MTSPAKMTLSAEAWGFKKEYELECKRKPCPGHKGPHEPALPPNVRLSGEGSWAIKVKFGKTQTVSKLVVGSGGNAVVTGPCKCGREYAHERSTICG